MDIFPSVARSVQACPEQWGDFVDFSNQVYKSLKNFLPKLPAYPILSHEAIMGVQDGQPCAGQGGKTATPPASLAACVGEGLALVSELQRDVFAVSMFPSVTGLSSGESHPTDAARAIAFDHVPPSHPCMNSPAPTPPPSPAGTWQLWYGPAVFDALDEKDAAAIAIASWGYDSTPIAINYANATSATAGQRAVGSFATPAAVLALGGVPAAADSAPTVPARLRSGASPSPTPICATVSTATTGDAADFLGYLVDLSTRYPFAYVSFYSSGDVLPADVVTSCPCKSTSVDGKALCAFLGLYRQICVLNGLPSWLCETTLKLTGSMGVRDYTGKQKADVYAALQAARAATHELPALLSAATALA